MKTAEDYMKQIDGRFIPHPYRLSRKQREEIKALIRDIQNEAFDEALNNAAEKAEVAEIEIIPPKPYDQRPYTKYVVNKDSILKLKK